MTRKFAALAVTALLLTACTSTPEPDPTPSPTSTSTASVPDPDLPEADFRVAVVVAPSPSLRAAAAEIMARQLPTFVEGVRTVRAVTADSAVAMPDLVRLFASQEFDLVCAVGPGALDAVVPVANDLPATKFCAAPAIAPEVPSNVLAVDFRVEEMAYLAGVLAGVYAPAQPPVMLTGPGAHATARQQQAFRDGFASTSPPEGIAPIVIGPAEDAEAAAELLADHLASGVSVIYSDAGDADEGVRDAAVAESARRAEARATPDPDADPDQDPDPAAGAPVRVLVAGGPALLSLEEGTPQPPEVAYLVEIHWSRGVVAAARELVGTWEGGTISIGMLEDGLQFSEAGGGGVPLPLQTRIEDTMAGIIDGRLSIRPAS